MVEFLIAKAVQKSRPEWKSNKPAPIFVLINGPGDQVLKSALQRQARYLDLWMIEVAPDATKFPNLCEDTPYLLYRTSVSGRQTEIGIFKNFICTSFAGEYSVLNDPNYDSNALYR